MKYIIEIDDDIAKGIRGENECEVEPRKIVRSFQATIAEAIANGIPYKPTVDAISREALKNITYINKGNFNTVEGIREWIDNAPAVKQQTDEWKEWTDERWGGTTIYCPYCKEEALEKYSDGLHRQVKSNFCPNCGLKLEKGGAAK